MEGALREYVRQEGLENDVDFIAACGPLQVVSSAIPFDVGIICYAGSTENLRRTAPNKLIDYMSAGLALVVPDLPGIRSLADESHGAFFEPGSAHDLARAIAPLIASEQTVAAHKAASLARGREHSWEIEQTRLVALYNGLMGIDAAGDRAPDGTPHDHVVSAK
jgi:glycosyltransferase involved in cell wall biosynthesis